MTAAIVIYLRMYLINQIHVAFFKTKNRFFVFLALCLFYFSSFALTDIEFSIGSMDSYSNSIFNIDDLDISLTFNSAKKIVLNLTTKRITTDFIDPINSIKLQCPIEIIEEDFFCKNGTINFIQAKTKHKAKIAFNYHANNGLKNISINNLNLFSGKQSISAKKKNKHWLVSFDLNNTNLKQLVYLLAKKNKFLEKYPIENGLLSLNGNFVYNGDTVTSINFNSSAQNLFLESEQVLEDAALETSLIATKKKHRWQIQNKTKLSSGALYLVPGFEVFESQPGFYIDLNHNPILIELKSEANIDFNQFEIKQFLYNHKSLMVAEAKGTINLAEDYPAQSLDVFVKANDLSKVYPVYLEPILLSTNYSDLKTSGSMSIDIRHEKEELKYLNLILNDLSIFDERNRFSMENLNSNIKMQDSNTLNTSNITWESLSIYKLPFGSADMSFESISNNYKLTNWQSVSLLDGGLDINTLKLDKIGETDFKLSLDGKLQPISLSKFTEAMSWPAMGGTLEGEIAGIEYTNNNLEILGDIDFKAFDGDIYLHGVKIENLFSTNSRLTSNLELKNLDIEILTDTFTFGKMEGTLNGYMNDFTLENWQPVYFDAKFETPKDDHRPHRISQKALENISELGGGVGSSLSSSLLKFIPSYSYGQFGISCRLERGVCNLGGVKNTKDGFYILTQGGLLPPWVDVMGSGRSILWDNLIEGIQQISEGEVQFE